MCGILGVVSLQNKGINTSCIKNMLDSIEHRGPDDAGYMFMHSGVGYSKEVSFFKELTDNKFINLNQNLSSIEDSITQSTLNSHDWDIFFGHRRLSILDLSSLGHQPMSDLTNQIWISYNGEIYNFKELREELKAKGHKFKTATDTEVIIYSYIEWGIECVKRFNGMFAIALYDNRNKMMFLLRDRYGIKPLYYTIADNDFIFASEIKAILKYPKVKNHIDESAVFEYFTFQNIFTNKTFNKNISILEAGHYMCINLQTKEIQKIEYWDFDFSEPDTIKDEREYIEELDRLFVQAVTRQLVSDVPVGAYLSGGIDSGSISAIASKKIENLQTFTVGFDLTSASGLELAFDERAKSEYLSYCFGTEHYEMVLKAGDMERCLPKFAYHLEEPRVGQSYPNYYAAKLASKFVKVVLAGTGGDEIFGGYPWRYFSLKQNDDDYFMSYYKFWQRLVPNTLIKELFSPVWNDVKDIWTLDIFKNVFKKDMHKLNKREDFIHASMYFEAKTFLHGILVVEDKLSMAHSIETRVPFLDNDLVDFGQKLPIRMKLSNLDDRLNVSENDIMSKKLARTHHNNDGKYIFRSLMNRYLPAKVTNEVKQGFSSPDGSWFKGESINFVKNIVFNDNAKIFNYLDKKVLRNLVNEHLSGAQNRRLFIWSLINFESILNGV